MSDYSVASLWRYPVKSMAGEQIAEIGVTSRGLDGDRAYALIDSASRKVGSAKNVKRFGALLRWRAQFVGAFQPDAPAPPVRLTSPEGASVSSTDADITEILTTTFGANVELVSHAPDDLILEFAAGTLKGKHAATTQLPVSSGAPKGTLFNYAAVHLITTSTLQKLDVAVDRFRANVIVDSPQDTGFPENDWVGRTVGIGTDLKLRVSIPCPRCVVPTLPRNELPLDSSVLPRITKLNTVNLGDFGDLPCVGVYAEVIQPGVIRRGDRLRIFD